VKVLEHRKSARLLDFGNNGDDDSQKSNMVVFKFDKDSISFLSYEFYDVNSGYSNILNVEAKKSIQLNTWTHVAVTYDGEYGFLYVNGTQVGSTQLLNSGPLKVIRNNCFIGKSSLANETSLANAYFDEIRIYKVALSQSEINLLTTNSQPTTTTRKKGCADSLPKITCENLIRSYRNFCENSMKMNMECMKSCNRTDC
jgi:hypothetical protein